MNPPLECGACIDNVNNDGDETQNIILNDHSYALRPHDRTLQVLWLNVCSLMTRMRVPDFKEKILNYDILVFQETKLDDLDNDYVKQYFSSLGFDCHFFK